MLMPGQCRRVQHIAGHRFAHIDLLRMSECFWIRVGDKQVYVLFAQKSFCAGVFSPGERTCYFG